MGAVAQSERHPLHYPCPCPRSGAAVLIHALLEGGAVPLASHKDAGGAGGAGGGGKQCGGKEAQLKAVLLTLVPFGLAAAASLAIGHSSEVCVVLSQSSKSGVIAPLFSRPGLRCGGMASGSRLHCSGGALGPCAVRMAGRWGGAPRSVLAVAAHTAANARASAGVRRAAAAHRAAADCRRPGVWHHAPLPALWVCGGGLHLCGAGRHGRGRHDRWAGGFGCHSIARWVEKVVRIWTPQTQALGRPGAPCRRR